MLFNQKSAASELEKLATSERELLRKWNLKRAEAAAARLQFTSELLNKNVDVEWSDTAGSRRIDALDREAALLGSVLDGIPERRRAALARSLEENAAALRAESAAKRAAAQKIDRETVRLLAKLSEIEGVRYTRAILLAERVGDWQQSVTGRPLSRCSPFESEPDITSAFALPNSEKLLREAEDIERQASQLQQREVRQHGRVEGATLDEIMNAITSQTSCVTPSLRAVQEWAEQCDRKAEQRGLHGNRVYILEWTEGRVDAAQSSVAFTAFHVDEFGVTAKEQFGSYR